MNQLVEFDRSTGADLIKQAIRRERTELLDQRRKIKSRRGYFLRDDHEFAVDGWVPWKPSEMLKLSRRHQINIAGEVLKKLEASGEVECYRDSGNRTARILSVRLPKKKAKRARRKVKTC